MVLLEVFLHVLNLPPDIVVVVSTSFLHILHEPLQIGDFFLEGLALCCQLHVDSSQILIVKD